MANDSFTDGLWRDIAPVFDAIINHPFLAELTDGSLARERFVFYMQQDALYLEDFGRALGLAGVRSPEAATVQAFLDFGSVAIAVERALHESYFEEFEASQEAEMAPACFAYTKYLLATGAVGSYGEIVAALLPCFWIYREVGKHIYTAATGGIEANPYRRWIETYSGDDYDEAVERAISITNRVAASASADEQALMRKAFFKSAQLEWMFWDSAYGLEAWQPG
jgi:thiaminase/transcriptional activator TenA